MKLKILNNGTKLVKGTNNSAGYDVVASEDITSKPWQYGEMRKCNTMLIIGQCS